MGYACPVCETPQADGEHLANHLAITAILGRMDHEEWLDEHAPNWEGSTPEELAAQVVEAVPETEFPQVFEDTTDQHHGHSHGESGGEMPFEQELARQTASPGRGTLTDETRDVMAEAREMTRQMLDEDGQAETDTDERTATANEEGAETDESG